MALLFRSADNSAVQHAVSLNKLSRLLPFSSVGTVLTCLDLTLILATGVLTGIGYHLVLTNWNDYGDIQTFFGVGALTAVNFSAILAARGAYRPQRLVGYRKQLKDISLVWIFAFFLLSFVAFSLKVSETYSRGATLSFFLFGWSTVAAWRLIASRLIAKTIAEGSFAERKIILLAEEGQLNGSDTMNQLSHYGYTPARTYEFSPNIFSATRTSAELAKSMEQIIDLSRKETIESVFLLLPWNDYRAVDRMMEFLRILAVPVYLLPSRNVAPFLDNRVINIGSTWILELKRAPLSPGEQIFKRLLDVLMASLLLTMLAPMMALIALLIKLESRGPVLFMQTRNGFSGRAFRICKFRTMSVLEDGPVVRQATKNDSRVTHLGWLLRRTSLDELPQLFNVIIGDMSLVGPRPHAAIHNSEYEKIIANYAYRYHVRPGLTGWAQINGFRGATQTLDLMAKRVEFDLWYINNWSFWLDCKILLRTLFIGLQANAY
jgi:undecaprenyl-phosphate galactose phosphotransferase/putative colanic acid biosynthesis UDP-glucose lipid carrier transferase